MTTLINGLLEKLLKPGRAGSFYGVNDVEANKIGTTLRSALYETHRYHLSSQSTMMAAMYSLNVNSVEEQVLKLARLPFKSVWLEWPLIDQLGAVGLKKHESAPDMVGAWIRKVNDGYLITDVFHAENVVICSPVSILYNPTTPIDYAKYEEDTKFFCQCLQRAHEMDPIWEPDPNNILIPVKAVLSKCLIGGSPSEVGLNDKFQNILSAPYAMHVFTPGLGKLIKRNIETFKSAAVSDSFMEVVAERLTETAGMFKVVISALALINTPTYIINTQIRPGQRNPSEPKITSKSKKSNNPAYDYVELKIPHTIIIQQLQGKGWNKRVTEQYEVTGHHCHSHKIGNPNCAHVYANQTETKEICLLCGAKRWWRKDHCRGDPELGIRRRTSKLVIPKGEVDE